MNIGRIIIVSATGLAAVACSEPTAPADRQALGFSTSGPQHHVVGAGHVQQVGGLREFTFHAIQHPNGSAKGSFKVVLPNGLFFEADVTCLAVDGNTGWVGGVIRDSNAAAVILGSVSTFYAIDNGEGRDAADIVSIAGFNGAAGTDLAFCADRPLALAPLEVTHGNVQVR